MDNILIVDDDDQLLFILEEGLREYHNKFQVITASDGLEAIQILQKEKISLVITDIVMPKVNGLVLMSYIRQNFPTTPYIIMTGEDIPGLRGRLQKESSYYFEKPFKLDDLTRAILSILNKEKNLSGVLAGIPISSFLKLIELEYISCVCMISSKQDKGYLFFDCGVLINAHYDKLRGEQAALEILKLDGATIRFQTPPEKEIPRRINRKLSDLLAEAKKPLIRPEGAEEAAGDNGLQRSLDAEPDQRSGEVLLRETASSERNG